MEKTDEILGNLEEAKASIGKEEKKLGNLGKEKLQIYEKKKKQKIKEKKRI